LNHGWQDCTDRKRLKKLTDEVRGQISQFPDFSFQLLPWEGDNGVFGPIAVWKKERQSMNKLSIRGTRFRLLLFVAGYNMRLCGTDPFIKMDNAANRNQRRLTTDCFDQNGEF
jgi:hypothetical protein